MKFSINHEPDKTVPAGGTFFEPRGALHTSFGSADPDAPVRIVAFLVVPTGSPLTGRGESRARGPAADNGRAPATSVVGARPVVVPWSRLRESNP